MVLNERLYCAHWKELNDPMEGWYAAYAENGLTQDKMENDIDQARDPWRITSLSATNNNFLLWSHYADGHKGIAIEVNIPKDHPYLKKIRYTWVETVFTHSSQTEYSMRHLFEEKSEEWKYEREYRIIHNEKYFMLANPIRKILIGPRANQDQLDILRKAVGTKVRFVQMQLDKMGRGLSVVPSSKYKKY